MLFSSILTSFQRLNSPASFSFMDSFSKNLFLFFGVVILSKAVNFAYSINRMLELKLYFIYFEPYSQIYLFQHSNSYLLTYLQAVNRIQKTCIHMRRILKDFCVRLALTTHDIFSSLHSLAPALLLLSQFLYILNACMPKSKGKDLVKMAPLKSNKYLPR